jgi:hypothetical protein
MVIITSVHCGRDVHLGASVVAECLPHESLILLTSQCLVEQELRKSWQRPEESGLHRCNGTDCEVDGLGSGGSVRGAHHPP